MDFYRDIFCGALSIHGFIDDRVVYNNNNNNNNNKTTA